jgi:hypothetical protein
LLQKPHLFFFSSASIVFLFWSLLLLLLLTSIIHCSSPLLPRSHLLLRPRTSPKSVPKQERARTHALTLTFTQEIDSRGCYYYLLITYLYSIHLLYSDSKERRKNDFYFNTKLLYRRGEMQLFWELSFLSI